VGQLAEKSSFWNPNYSPTITRGSTGRKILILLKKMLLIVANQNIF
jgi:hypothetical protein